MRRCVIVAGAEISNYKEVIEQLREDDFHIFCDSGLYHQKALQIAPDLIVGDFDSHPAPEGTAETIVLPREKDDTDTVFAVKEALRRGFEEFLLLGVIGGRIDHTLANLSLLIYLHRLGKRGKILDDYGELEAVGWEGAAIDGSWPYFSVLNITGECGGVTIRGAKFPLTNAEIPCTDPYGVSNEPLPGQVATVTVDRGEALLARIKRDIRR